jgi:peptide/nickel transport system substrate-binding protein
MSGSPEGEQEAAMVRKRRLALMILSILGPFATLGALGTSPAAAQGGGRVVIGIPTPPTTFQPYFFSIAFYHLYNQFYNVLVRLDPNQRPQPELAENWEVSPDGATVTLRLRRGVRFHSGREFTASDVKRSHARATHPDIHANSKPLFQTIREVEVLGPQAVRLNFKGPNPAVFDLLDQLWIIDDDQYDKSTTQPIGSGPFTLKEYRPGDKIVLQPFKEYWKTKPRLDEVEYRIIQDPQALVLNLESGTLDAVGQVNVKDAERLERAGFAVEVASEGILYNVMFNTKEGRFTNRNLRQVFVHATNRDRFIRIVLAGKSKPLCLPWVPTNFAYDAKLDATCDFNLTKAKQFLVEAGYPNGLDVTLYTSTQWYYGMTKLAELLQADLKRIGVNVKLEDVDTAEYVKRHNNLGYEVIMSLTGRVNRDPSTMLTTTSTMRAQDNAAGYHNPQYVELVTQATSTVDLEKRRRLFGEINRMIRDDFYTMPVATSPFLFAYHRKLKNIRYSVDGFVYLEEAVVAR